MLLLLTKNLVKLINLIDDGYTITAIRELTRFHNPYISKRFTGKFSLFNSLLLLLDISYPLLIVMEKSLILSAFQPVTNVKG
jgi:hypothetical protein